jgi:hypothetical protein
MPAPSDPLDALLDTFAERVAAKVIGRLQPREPERVLLRDAAKRGAPSARWVTEQARAGRIAIKGPRGARYVDAAALAELLASATIRRRVRPPLESGAVLRAEATNTVAELASRRLARTGRGA